MVRRPILASLPPEFGNEPRLRYSHSLQGFTGRAVDACDL